MGIPDAHLDLMEGYRPREVHRYAGGKSLPGGHGNLKGDGNWVLSTVDAMRFLTSLDGTRGEEADTAVASGTKVDGVGSRLGEVTRLDPVDGVSEDLVAEGSGERGGERSEVSA